MMLTPFEVIRKKIRDELNRVTDEAINGAANDFAQYRFMCGLAYALAQAEDIVRETEKSLFNDDSDDDVLEDDQAGTSVG